MNTREDKNRQALIAIVDDDQSFREAISFLNKPVNKKTLIDALNSVLRA
jgi:FixJ family two-component response regulator